MRAGPKWYRNGVIYQIFADSFHHDNHSAHQKKAQGKLSTQSRPIDWDMPRTTGFDSDDFYGGDLNGIIQKLDHIKDLGANILYLTPVMTSDSNHHYNIQDYRSVDPSLGTLDDFRRLTDEIHRKDMKLIVDLVFSHCSNHHPWFEDTLRNPQSRYRNMFHFTSDTEYLCWRNVKSVPMWNLTHPEVIDDLITGENSVLKFWIGMGIDGIRLDCANDLGPEITRLITDTVHADHPEMPVIGEVFSFASGWKDACDGVQSYYFTASIMSLLMNRITPSQFGKNILESIEKLGWDAIRSSWVMIASHDIARAKNVLQDDTRKLLLAVTLLFTLPGIPLIYYGEEVGMTGGNDPLNRNAMIWDEQRWDQSVLKRYTAMIRLKNRREELRNGEFYELSQWLNNSVAAFYRATDVPGEFSLILINPSDKHIDFRLFVPYPFFFDAMTLVEHFSNEKCRNHMGYFDMKLEPYQVAIYTPKPDAIDNYDFYHRLKKRPES